MHLQKSNTRKKRYARLISRVSSGARQESEGRGENALGISLGHLHPKGSRRPSLGLALSRSYEVQLPLDWSDRSKIPTPPREEEARTMG